MKPHCAIKRVKPRPIKGIGAKRRLEQAARIATHARLIAETGYRPKGVRP